MEVAGTKQAFQQMIAERGVYNKIGVSRSTVSNWKRAFEGQDIKNIPTIDKMEEMLLKYGVEVLQEKIWKFRK